ncbi:BnaC01g40060D [Brassica napus]|uniref:BnaC01g40060D protein n=1 Tax=Brassica napus TaxID=3708 RepID=A0A078GXP2_BRANA|nr:BnaC01g40060D [Brassica napus]
MISLFQEVGVTIQQYFRAKKLFTGEEEREASSTHHSDSRCSLVWLQLLLPYLQAP